MRSESGISHALDRQRRGHLYGEGKVRGARIWRGERTRAEEKRYLDRTLGMVANVL